MIENMKTTGTWAEVLDDCRSSVGKSQLGKEPSPEWKQRMAIAEHSPIRRIKVAWVFRQIKYWVAMHFKTHIWYSIATTQRSDRQSNYDRDSAPQNQPVDLSCEANLQHLIDTSRKRLCRMAHPETRAEMEKLKLGVREHLPEVAFCMVPNCIYRCGCPEMNGCGYYANLLEKDPMIGSSDIAHRYAAYARLEDLH